MGLMGMESPKAEMVRGAQMEPRWGFLGKGERVCLSGALFWRVSLSRLSGPARERVAALVSFAGRFESRRPVLSFSPREMDGRPGQAAMVWFVAPHGLL